MPQLLFRPAQIGRGDAQVGGDGIERNFLENLGTVLDKRAKTLPGIAFDDAELHLVEIQLTIGHIQRPLRKLGIEGDETIEVLFRGAKYRSFAACFMLQKDRPVHIIGVERHGHRPGQGESERPLLHPVEIDGTHDAFGKNIDLIVVRIEFDEHLFRAEPAFGHGVQKQLHDAVVQTVVAFAGELFNEYPGIHSPVRINRNRAPVRPAKPLSTRRGRSAAAHAFFGDKDTISPLLPNFMRQIQRTLRKIRRFFVRQNVITGAGIGNLQTRMCAIPVANPHPTSYPLFG